jgi:hypothetical protein
VNANRLIPWLIAVAMTVLVVVILSLVFGVFGSF